MSDLLLTSPLVLALDSRRPFSHVAKDDVVTANVYNPDTGEFDQPINARVKRIGHGQVWIRVIGFTDPLPYRIGDNLVIQESQVTGW